MTQIATVERILDTDHAEISVPRKSACGHDCEECAGCGVSGASVYARASNPIGAQPGQRSGLSNQVLPGSAGKGHGDFRASCTDFQAAHVYGVHKSTPFCSYMVSVYLTAKRRFWQAVPIRAPLRLWGET